MLWKSSDLGLVPPRSKLLPIMITVYLDQARERGLKLNHEKVKLRQSSVPFIGHYKGLAPDLSSYEYAKTNHY